MYFIYAHIYFLHSFEILEAKDLFAPKIIPSLTFLNKNIPASSLFSPISPFTFESTSILTSSLSAALLQTSRLNVHVMWFHHTVMNAPDVNQRLQLHNIFI